MLKRVVKVWETPNLLDQYSESITNEVTAPPSTYKHLPLPCKETAMSITTLAFHKSNKAMYHLEAQ